jgi:hypothetical protein
MNAAILSKGQPTLILSRAISATVTRPEISELTKTWKKSYERPMFPNTAGSSHERVIGTPWLRRAGKGCIGIEDVRRLGYGSMAKQLDGMWTYTRISFLLSCRVKKKKKRNRQGNIRNWAHFKCNTTLTAELDQLRVLDQGKSPYNKGLFMVQRMRVYIPMANALGSQQNSIVKVVVCCGTVT